METEGVAVDDFVKLFEGNVVDLDAIAVELDALDHAGRVAATRRLGKSAQARLFDAAAGRGGLSLLSIVPAGVPLRTAVRHHGKNTLPLFSKFEKRFCRPSPGSERLWGYNHQSLAWLTGPGYFLARADVPSGEIVIEYSDVPPETPDGWPRVRPNTSGMGRIVYGGMVDVLRRVSRHVTIGSAFKKGKSINSWFILCRED
ncbi:MAG: hypothetical protein HYY84_20275 [Deltaproteobacteria bacterium]|nr:hypothetical protein [Deltaproteobacteria bacterium]